MVQWIPNPLATQMPIESTRTYEMRETKSLIPPVDANPKDIKSRVSNLGIAISTKRNQFLTTDLVQGQVQIDCHSDKVKIGKILVSLIGIEENLRSKKARPRKFLSKTLILQDNELAITDAVHPGSADEHEMWLAKTGTTVIDFEIPFQNLLNNCIIEDVVDMRGNYPSSYWNAKMGGIRYILAVVTEFSSGKAPKYPLAAYEEIYCIESVPFRLGSHFQELSPMTLSLYQEKKIELKSSVISKSSGTLKLSCSLQTLEIEGSIENGIWASGGLGYVNVAIDNYTSRRVDSLTLKVIGMEKTYRFVTSKQEFEISDYKKKPITTMKFKQLEKKSNSGLEIAGFGASSVPWAESNKSRSKIIQPWVAVAPNQSRRQIVALRLPLNAYSIRNSSLIDVSYSVKIQAKITGGKFVEMEIPITILHPSSLLSCLPEFGPEVFLPKGGVPVKYDTADFSSPAPVAVPTVQHLKAESAFTSYATLGSYSSIQEPDITKRIPARLARTSKSVKPQIETPSPAALELMDSLAKSI